MTVSVDTIMKKYLIKFNINSYMIEKTPSKWPRIEENFSNLREVIWKN